MTLRTPPKKEMESTDESYLTTSPKKSRGAGLGHPMDPGVSVQNKNYTRNKGSVNADEW